jgi:hypothetical protein
MKIPRLVSVLIAASFSFQPIVAKELSNHSNATAIDSFHDVTSHFAQLDAYDDNGATVLLSTRDRALIAHGN